MDDRKNGECNSRSRPVYTVDTVLHLGSGYPRRIESAESNGVGILSGMLFPLFQPLPLSRAGRAPFFDPDWLFVYAASMAAFQHELRPLN